MKQQAAMNRTPGPIAERILVALDVDGAETARSICSELKGLVSGFKVGLQLFTSAGPGFVRELVEADVRVFLDLKFHDIPNTVARASVEAARLGVWMFNVHASGGSEMMRTAAAEMRNACERESLRAPRMIAVTVLTSSDASTLEETGIAASPIEQVLRLAELTAECGLDGVVASPLDVEPIKHRIASKRFLVVTPGVRPALATNDDQKRVMTPEAALKNGADLLVIGRPITAAQDRAKAVEAILNGLTIN
ncbi:MAG: orotidine-5'-phosphate decarboxylase [Pyrinomonadaceae bacterium]